MFIVRTHVEEIGEVGSQRRPKGGKLLARFP